MDLLTIIFVALGLAADAFAVAVTCGFGLKRFSRREAGRVALFFGFFQMVMPVLGWFAGSRFSALIENVDHWLAFALLGMVGGKMIRESRKSDEGLCSNKKLDLSTLSLLALATSIDALAVGLSLAFIDGPIYYAAAVIGAVTFVLSFLGVYLGKRFGSFNKKRIEAAGGLILILIGIKILIEHLR